MATTVAGADEVLQPPHDPAPSPGPRRGGRLRTLLGRRRWLVLAAVVVLAGTGVGVYLATRGSAASYRTVPAAYSTIRQEISATGTIQDVNQADLNFGVSGLVKTVDVTVGQKVTAGQVLATEDTTSLQASLDSARANVASAESKLDTDLQGATSQQLTSAQGQVASAGLSVTTAQQNVVDTQQSNAQSLATAQAAVQSAETTLSNDQATYQQDQSSLSAAQQKESYDCQGDASGGAGSGGSGAGSGASGGTGAGSSGSGTAGSSSQCSADETAVASDQSKVNQDQQTVAKDQAAVQSAQQALQSTQLKNTQSLQQAQNQLASAQLALTNAQNSLTALQTSATPAQLAADRASVASAQAGLATAQDNLDNATIASPIAGTVAAVNITVGQSASGGGSSSSSSSGSSSGSSAGSALQSLLGGSSSSSSSSSASSSGEVVVISPGTYAVSTTVSDSEIGQVKVGDQAIITPDGSVAPVFGTVSAVGLVATSSSGVATYPLTIAVTGSPSGLYAGAGANVSIVVQQLTNVLTVPTSAVHTLGARSFVYLLQNGKEVAQPVTVGGSGSGLTQITSGLQAGQAVVLANLSASLPSGGAGTTGGRGLGGGGGFGGLGGGGGFGGLGGGGGFGGLGGGGRLGGGGGGVVRIGGGAGG